MWVTFNYFKNELSPYEFYYFHDPLFKINFASIHQIKGLTTSNKKNAAYVG